MSKRRQQAAEQRSEGSSSRGGFLPRRLQTARGSCEWRPSQTNRIPVSIPLAAKTLSHSRLLYPQLVGIILGALLSFSLAFIPPPYNAYPFLLTWNRPAGISTILGKTSRRLQPALHRIHVLKESTLCTGHDSCDKNLLPSTIGEGFDESIRNA